MKFKNVIVTGGSSGIGLDLAKAYVKLGANVMLIARNKSRLEDAVKACSDLCVTASQKVMAFSVDVGDSKALNLVVNDIKGQVGALDLLILSAGIVQSVRFMEQTDQDFNDIMHTNLVGSRTVAKAFLPEMIKQGKGQVCFVSSLGGLIPTYGYSAYSASKFAVIGMAGALRQELYSSGVGVSVLCPPEVNTPMVAKEASHILPETRFVKDLGGLLSTSTVTKATIKGINKNTFIILPGFKGKMSYMFARFMPNIFAWVIQKLVGLASKVVK